MLNRTKEKLVRRDLERKASIASPIPYMVVTQIASRNNVKMLDVQRVARLSGVLIEEYTGSSTPRARPSRKPPRLSDGNMDRIARCVIYKKLTQSSRFIVVDRVQFEVEREIIVAALRRLRALEDQENVKR